MGSFRAVVTDLDGTVVDDARRVSRSTLRAADELRARGIPLIVVTARTPSWIAHVAGPLADRIAVAACCAGAVGWSPATGLLWRDAIRPATVDHIVALVAGYRPEVGLAAYDGERWRMTETFAATGPTRRGPVDLVSPARLAEHPVCTMSIHAVVPGTAELLGAEVARIRPPLTVARSRPAVLDIAAPGTDKAAAVGRALAEVGVDPADAVVFGDAPADLPMFALCGSSAAMANADPEVIASAGAVVACVHRDGFARTLYEWGVVAVPPEIGPEPRCVCPRHDRPGAPSLGA